MRLLALVTLEASNIILMSSVTLASLSLFFQLEHRQNKGRLVSVSGANGVSIAATLVETNNTSRAKGLR